MVFVWEETRLPRGTEQNRTLILFVKTCTYIHHHTKHLIQLYTPRLPRGKQPVSPGDQMTISHDTAMYRTQVITGMQYK